MGISVVVVEEIGGYPVPELAGRTTLEGDLSVIELGAADPQDPPTHRVALMGLAWLAWLAVLLSPVGVVWRIVRPGRDDPAAGA